MNIYIQYARVSTHPVSFNQVWYLIFNSLSMAFKGTNNVPVSFYFHQPLDVPQLTWETNKVSWQIVIINRPYVAASVVSGPSRAAAFTWSFFLKCPCNKNSVKNTWHSVRLIRKQHTSSVTVCGPCSLCWCSWAEGTRDGSKYGWAPESPWTGSLRSAP